MKKILFVLALLFLWMPVNAGNGPGTKESTLVEGTWVPVDAELGGQKFPDQVLKMMKLVINEGKYTVTVGPQTDKGTVTCDPTSRPKTIDITGTEGPNQGKTFLAIYELAGDTLRICYDLGGKDRPTAFKTTKETQQFLVNYVRAKN